MLFMGIDKNRVFDKEAIQSLSTMTQNLMNTADIVINEIYGELNSLSNAIANLPSDVRDSLLKDDIDNLKSTIKTDTFKSYSANIKKRLKSLSDTICTQDNNLGKKIAAVVVDMATITTKLTELKDLIPDGADSGSFEDFKKKYIDCVDAWNETEKNLSKIKQELVDGVLGGVTPGTFQSADPVNLGTGNFIYEKEDMKLEGTPAMSLTRFYNTLDRETGSLGKGWRHSFEIFLKINNDEVQLYLPDGKKITFRKIKEGTYTSDKTRDRLVKEHNIYCLKKSNGDTFQFDLNGNCLCFEEESGNRISYSMEDGLLKRVKREDDGASYEFHYNAEKKLESISDSTGRSIIYEYSEEGSLQKASCLAGGFFAYQYEQSGYISKVSSVDGTAIVENFFDNQGRCTSQNFPDGGSVSFGYDDENSCITLTERNGSITKYFHDEHFHNNRIVYEDGEEHFIYNRKGQCTYHKNQNGVVTRYSYDARGNVTQVMDALGNKTNATYDAKNHLLSVKVNGKNKLRNEYNTKGELISTVVADSSNYQMKYDENEKVTEITQPDGSRFSFQYDKNGNLSMIKNPKGTVTYYQHDALNRVVETVDGNGNKTSFAYDNADQIVSIVNAAGNKRTYEYNQRGRVSKIVDFDGHSVEVGYNCLNRPESITDKEGNITKFEYDLMWNLSAKVTPDGARTSYVYNRANRMEQVLLPEGESLTYEYDAVGNQIGMTDAEGNYYIYEYDVLNRMTSMIEPNGAKTTYEYDDEDHVTAVIDAMGNVSSYTYDELGRKVSEIDPLGNKNSFSYTLLGKVKEVTYSNGTKTVYEYEPGGRLAKVTQPSGVSVSYQYDMNGNKISEKNNLGEGVEYQYDCMNQVTAVINLNGGVRSYEYDAVGNVTKMIDENGNDTWYEYSPNGNLVKVRDALGNEISYKYDQMSRLVKILRYGDKIHDVPDQITCYQWNLSGRIERITDPLGTVESFRYDKNGNVKERIDRDGYKTSYVYNHAGDVTDILYADGRTASFLYNPLRQLEEVKDWFGTTKIELDALGRALSVTDFRGKKVSYEWGSVGEKKKVVYPNGKVTHYVYNKQGALETLIDDGKEIAYEYDILGRLSKKHLPYSIETQYRYNSFGRVESLKHTGKSGLELSYVFRYDLAGNKIAEERTRSDYPEDSGLYEYKYDKLNQIVEVMKDGKPVRKYVYDGFGNRVSKLEYTENDVQETIYQYNMNNQLVNEANSDMEKTYIYDLRGNICKVMSGNRLIQEFSFGTANEMTGAVSYKDGITKSEKFRYNGLGKRVTQSIFENQEDKLNPLKNIQYTLDLTREYYNLLSQEEELTQESQRFVWDGNAVGMEQNDKDSYYLQDDLGSVLNLVGKDSQTLEKLAYDEFGRVRDGRTKNVQPFRFTGYQPDETIGLYFAQARMYDPEAGRFVSEDIKKGYVEQTNKLNQYIYCHNQPDKYIDPDGKIAILAVIATGALIGGICGFAGSVISEAVSSGSIKNVNWKNVAVDTVSGVINGGVAAIPGIGTAAVVATGAVSGGASYEIKNAFNGNFKEMTLSEHLSGFLFNGLIGAAGNYGGCIAGPKNICGEVVSTKNIVALESAMNSAFYKSGKDFNKMFMMEVYKGFTTFNLRRTALINTILTTMNVTGAGNSIQTSLDKVIANLYEKDLNEKDSQEGCVE